VRNHYNRLEDLPKIFWDVICAPYWNNFGGGRCKRQAEFLIQNRYPLELVQTIGVMDETMRAQVEGVVSASNFRPLINVRRAWYF